MRRVLLLSLLLMPGACNHGPSASGQASAASPNAQDPALTGALADEIMVDPDLSQQADAHVAAATPRPIEAAMPFLRPTAPRLAALRHAPPAVAGSGTDAPTVTLLAEEQSPPSCRGHLAYSAAWAARFPAPLPVYPEGQVEEAAGLDAAACHLRVVSFVTAADPGDVIDYYYTRAQAAGYGATHREHGGEQMLAGSRAGDGSLYFLSVVPGADGILSVRLVTATAS